MSNTIYAHFNGEIVPLADANLNIKTHAFNYGTACFEGIRGYYNPEENQVYIFRLREHFERMAGSVRILSMTLPGSVDELVEMTLEVVRKNDYHENIYMRPTAYISSEVIGVKLHGLEYGYCMYCVPMGDYVSTDGMKVGVSSWKRIDDNMIPARAKIAGSYVNSAFAKSEAILNGYDEAVMLTTDGHVSEGSAENIFMVVGGKIVTPPVNENILVGITRHTVMTLVKQELGLEVIERVIDRTELYTCDELIMCGTGAQIAPCISVDHRPVGTGKIGPVATQLQALYMDVVRGKIARYKEWCTPVYQLAATGSVATASASSQV